MFSVVVRRGDGLHQGDDIIDPLIKVLPVALARGRNELDERASGFQQVDVTVPFRTGLRLGQVVQVTEQLLGETWYGKLSGISHVFDGATMITTLRLRRPSEFTV
jgi:hypothetical protein